MLKRPWVGSVPPEPLFESDPLSRWSEIQLYLSRHSRFIGRARNESESRGPPLGSPEFSLIVVVPRFEPRKLRVASARPIVPGRVVLSVIAELEITTENRGGMVLKIELAR